MWTAIALAGALGTGPAGDTAPPPRLASPAAPVASPFGETSGPSPYRLRRGEGRGMVIAGAVLAGLSHMWLAALEGAMWADVAKGALYCDDDPDLCEDDDLVVGMLTVAARPPAVVLRWVGVSLLGAGLSRHGRAIRRRGLPANGLALPRLRRRRAAGLGLIGGAAVLTLLNAVPQWLFLCYPADDYVVCTHLVRVGLMSASSAMIGAGLALGPYADGYLREDARLRSVRVAPLGLPGGAGLVVGGRF